MSDMKIGIVYPQTESRGHPDAVRPPGLGPAEPGARPPAADPTAAGAILASGASMFHGRFVIPAAIAGVVLSPPRAFVSVPCGVQKL